jgi:hypothetical protein
MNTNHEFLHLPGELSAAQVAPPREPMRTSLPPAHEEVEDPAAVVAELKRRILQAVAQRRVGYYVYDPALPADEPSAPAPRIIEPASTACWGTIAGSLAQVEAKADIGNAVPEMSRFGGPIRLLARSAARVVLFLTRFLNNRQRECNLAVRDCLYNLATGIREVDHGYAQRLRAVEIALQDFAGQLAAGTPPRRQQGFASEPPACSPATPPDETGTDTGLCTSTGTEARWKS